MKKLLILGIAATVLNALAQRPCCLALNPLPHRRAWRSELVY